MNEKRGNYRAGPSNLGICVLLVAGTLACIVLAVLASVYDTFPGDIVIAAAFEALRNVWLDALFRGLTRLGDPVVATALVAGTALALMVWRRWADAAVLAFTLAPVLLNYLLKELVARPRPVHIWADLEVATFSFPSGHAVLAIYYFGFLDLSERGVGATTGGAAVGPICAGLARPGRGGFPCVPGRPLAKRRNWRLLTWRSSAPGSGLGEETRWVLPRVAKTRAFQW